MTDKIIGDTLLDSLAEVIGLGKHRQDNHGNVQHGIRITCSDGAVIDYPFRERRQDNLSVGWTANYFDALDGDYTLNDIESPLKVRCDQAREARGQGI